MTYEEAFQELLNALSVDSGQHATLRAALETVLAGKPKQAKHVEPEAHDLEEVLPEKASEHHRPSEKSGAHKK
jgi:hypothetical protein